MLHCVSYYSVDRVNVFNKFSNISHHYKKSLCYSAVSCIDMSVLALVLQSTNTSGMEVDQNVCNVESDVEIHQFKTFK